MNPTHPKEADDILPEYDFTHAARGKHHESYRAGTTVVFLEPDLAAVFKDSASVNRVLRLLLKLAKDQLGQVSRNLAPGRLHALV